jgi:hypothetical protein
MYLITPKSDYFAPKTSPDTESHFSSTYPVDIFAAVPTSYYTKVFLQETSPK